jgi:GMP synthase-like glutamine amidotransferase
VPLDRYAAVATLGSVASVNDGDDWIQRETEVLRTAIATGVPILGLCFGGQSLAHAAGGAVRRADRSEIGLVTLRSDDPRLVAEGPWFAWHHDGFEPPPGATEVARSTVSSHAFTLGPHLGLQFHPEADADIVARWVAANPGDVEAAGLDPERVIAELRARARAARTLAFALFDGFWTRARS